MDFLDPKRKKSHRRRLLLGYVLMAVALSMGTYILLFTANGFNIDRKTGNIIQNGTVFVDSQPGDSTVFLDGVVQRNRTATRLPLPGGKQYTVRLENEGYRDWNRTFSLDGGQIERLDYPLLIPKTLVTTELELYATAPRLATQSPDLRWLLIQHPSQKNTFELFDLNNAAAAPAVLTIPESALTGPDRTKNVSLSAIEWSEDNNHVLLKRTYGSRHEFISLNTENIDSTININKVLGVNPDKVVYRDEKANQLYLFSVSDGSLRRGDTQARNISAPILSNVIDFKAFGPEVVLYITGEGATKGKVNFRIRENDKASYLLRAVPGSGLYHMDISEYKGVPYFIVGSEQENSMFLYRDPIPSLKGQRNTALLVTSVMRLTAPKTASFSPEGQFASAQAGNDIIVYDIEDDRQFKIDITRSLMPRANLEWVDTHRFGFVSGGNSFIIDFDGSNEQKLSSNSMPLFYFSPNFKKVFSVSESLKVKGRFALTETSLVAE